jgi:dihydrofolate reductase
MTLSVIAAVARNGAIGKDNQLLWRIPQDLQFFKRTTLGMPVIMGRKTWDSLPERFRPLPGRRNIVVTRNAQWHAEGVERAESLQAAMKLVATEPKAFVIGGAQLYAQALPLADEVVLTEVDAEFEADAFFPAWDRNAFEETSRESHPADASQPLAFAFVTYRRKR